MQGGHEALVHLWAALRTLAVTLYRIGNDIRLLSCGPRAGFAELTIPANEPGSSIMPGKVNPFQAEAPTMLAVQVMANDIAIGFGGPHNLMQSVRLLTDGCVNLRRFLVEGTHPNLKRIGEFVEWSPMLVTALSPVIRYAEASKIAHVATA